MRKKELGRLRSPLHRTDRFRYALFDVLTHQLDNIIGQSSVSSPFFFVSALFERRSALFAEKVPLFRLRAPGWPAVTPFERLFIWRS